MQITVNNRSMSIQNNLSLAQLLVQLTVPHRDRIALAVNHQIISRSGWSAYRLQEGDRVTLIEAAAGG